MTKLTKANSTTIRHNDIKVSLVETYFTKEEITDIDVYIKGHMLYEGETPIDTIKQVARYVEMHNKHFLITYLRHSTTPYYIYVYADFGLYTRLIARISYIR